VVRAAQPLKIGGVEVGAAILPFNDMVEDQTVRRSTHSAERWAFVSLGTTRRCPLGRLIEAFGPLRCGQQLRRHRAEPARHRLELAHVTSLTTAKGSETEATLPFAGLGEEA
jgi:hypothetical protein